MMDLEVGGDRYSGNLKDGWIRLSQDGAIVGYASKRETRLLDEIERLNKLLMIQRR